MFIAKDLPTPEDVIFPLGDLYSDEPQLESYLHLQQMLLLLKCLEWWWRDRLAAKLRELGIYPNTI
jgi:Uma2 family endonuclease